MSELLVAVQIAGRRCVLRAHDVQSVIELGETTPVPGAPDYVVGLTALRSQALTVIDCRRAIGFDPEKCDTDIRAPVVAVNGFSYALIVDLVEDVTQPEGEPDGVLGGFGPEWARVARGMVETSSGPALMIDAEKLIEEPIRQRNAA